MKIELLWFDDCPNRALAESLLRERIAALGVDALIIRIRIPDQATGRTHMFPGSPTIRVNGTDVEPGWVPCDDDCAPRCRLYRTADGLRGIPELRWIDAALHRALAAVEE